MMKNQTQLDPISRLEKIIMSGDQKNFPAKTIKRGTKGRFVSIKINQLVPDGEMITVTFYSKPIRKYFVAGKQHFVVSDILSLATPTDISIDMIKYTDNFDEIKNQVIKIIDQLEVADAEGILTLIKEVIGVFPGPLARWLTT